MIKRVLAAAGIVLLLLAVVNVHERGRAAALKTTSVPMRIDAANVHSLDPWALTEPVFWTASIYDGPEAYEKSLAPFIRAQRLINAINWYQAEVNNGGHGQFYANSTGIVWRDALAGFELLGLDELAENLRESVRRLGGDPPLDRAARSELLERLQPDFADLDRRLWDGEQALDAAIRAYARSHPDEFYFDGVVQLPDSQQPGFMQRLFFTF